MPDSLPDSSAALLSLLWCPLDHGSLRSSAGAFVCTTCNASYPVVDGVVCMVEGGLSEDDRREMEGRDAQAEWYDEIHGGYTDAAEITPTVRALGRPEGPVLELGAGTGRLTRPLAEALGQPVLATDYSVASLARLVHRCAGLPVLAVQADARSVPVRDQAMAAALAAELYPMVRADGRLAVLHELHRALRPGGRAAISTLNYNATFRAWHRLGNASAREGDQLLGGDGYFVRLTRGEFRAELERVFSVEKIIGLRNIPARSLTSLVGRAAGRSRGERMLEWMTRTGVVADHAVGRTPLAGAIALYHLATVRRRDELGTEAAQPISNLAVQQG
jgi:SAM-dependent methyltransferase